MKRAIIVHCWGGYPEYCWYPYVKRELESRGFEVSVPAMPDTDEPNLTKWLTKLKNVAREVDENTYLIGHSAGCITIMRYLELLPTNQKIGGVIFVAGFTDDLGFVELKNFFITPINFQKIKSQAKDFVAIASDNDPYVPLDRAEILKNRLGAKVITKRKMQHFSGAKDKEETCLELADVIDSVLELENKKIK